MTRSTKQIGRRREPRAKRVGLTLVLGFLLGGILSKVSEFFLADSAAREFLTTSVDASLGPLSIDLYILAFTLGPVTISANVLTVFGVLVVALAVRSLL